MASSAEKIQTCCCIVGGGPAGMMLGFLLARSGVEVLILEKHADFLRDFRGDTIHPSTLQLMHELGLLEEFLKRPHTKAREIHANIGGQDLAMADFSHLPTACPFIVFMPQWDFLNFLVEQAQRFPHFHLRMESEVTDVLCEGGQVAGVRAKTRTGELEVRATLVVGTDGRSSTVRERAGLEVDDLGAPMDVLWMRLPRRPDDPEQSLGRANSGGIFIKLDRGDYWQCGLVIRKGAFEEIKQRGLAAFQDRIAFYAPLFRDRVAALDDWNKIRLLVVTVDHLRCWHAPGLLCLGDSAHAMSPIGGVGINLAIQDAVAAANVLAQPLGQGQLSQKHLARIQGRRERPTRWTQRMQLFIQKRVISGVLKSDQPLRVPLVFKLLNNFPLLRRLPGRVIGMGFRPEHVRTKARP